MLVVVVGWFADMNVIFVISVFLILLSPNELIESHLKKAGLGYIGGSR